MSLLYQYKLVDQVFTNFHYQIDRFIPVSGQDSVLVKTINAEFLATETQKKLKYEYALLKKCYAKGIIKPYALENDDQQLVLILEDFYGQNLTQFLQQQRVSFPAFLLIGIQLAEALQEIHQQGIIHQNIQPNSILINPESLDLKILDFSQATDASSTIQAAPELLSDLNIPYIAPEQTGRMNIPIDYRADFYSLGVLFYQILTGVLPYDAQDSLELIHCHLARIPLAPDHVDHCIPVAVSAIIMKLLAKNPEDRYQSASAIKADLENCQTQYANRGEIEEFELGTLDLCSQFEISPKLYGRTTELQEIAESLARINSETPEMLILKGDTGIGKTALVREIIPTIIGKRGYFVTGKFEPLTKDVPHKAIIQALRELIQRLLTETSENRQQWRQKIQSAVANNGKVVTNILPELELIIGCQPEIPKLSAKESQNRFNNVFVKLLQVFSQVERPVVLFLDNLQWADSGSLNLLELLLDDRNSQHLLIVGAYRDRELDSTHPLVETIARISEKAQVNQLVLRLLTTKEINSLLVDTLRCQPTESLPLAQLLLQRTKGNPFFIHLLLQSFNREKLLNYDFISLSWRWSITEIQRTSIASYNILELICNNLNQLPHTCLQILKLAACIGNQFDLQLLSQVCQEMLGSNDSYPTMFDHEAIMIELNYALQEGIIVIEQSQSQQDLITSYQFLHDHIYQTIYSLVEEGELIHIHAVIGQFLLQQTSPEEIAENIFAIAHHLNIARTLLTDPSEINRLVKINLAASKKAKAANAYDVAAKYLDIALSLMPPSAWLDNYALMLAVYLEAAEVQHLQGNFLDAEQLGNIVLAEAETLLDRVQVYKTKIHAHIAQNNMLLAVDLGLHVLKLLNIDLPNNFTNSQEYTLCLDIKSENIESLRNLPNMTNPSHIQAMEILTTIIPPVYIVRPELFSVVVAKMIELCLQDGNCPLSAYAYALYGLLLCGSGNIDTGYQLGELALELQEQFDAKEIKSKVTFLFNNMIRHWREPAVSTLEHFLQGIQSGIEVGDLEYACFHAKYYCTYLFFVGELLPVAEEKSRQHIEMIAQFKQDFQLNYARIWHQLNQNLQGYATDKLLLIGDSFDESAIVQTWQEANNATSLFAFYLAKLILCYIFQDYQQALFYGRQGKEYINAAVGTMCCSEYYFYYGLALLATSPPRSKLQPFRLLDEIVDCQQKIKHWASHAPDHYQHKYELLTAEIAKVCGQNEQAATHYDQAITEATKVGYLHQSALGEELAGEFYLSQGRIKIASYYLTDAYEKYLSWGALAKIEELESNHLTLLTCIPKQELIAHRHQRIKPHTSSNYESCSNLANLDIFSVVKASQAISSEIILDNLLSKIMAIVMENAGAQKGILLLQQNSTWVVAASASINSAIQVDLPYLPTAEYQDLPHSIINYIQSTRSTIILEEADQEGMFVDEPYIILHQPQSVLCCPMIYQHELQGIIYLENSLVRGAFTSQKSAVLQVLLSQISISIENAHLYKDLEDHASVQKSLQQKEILLKEIHHRVKNNLFVVSSLLDFQSNYVDDPKVNKLLENCQNRITAMAMVHQHLYGNSELDRINFACYIESLLDNLAYSQGSQERNIKIALDLQPIELNIESANPCGLIVNELVSNALEHGFGDRSSGNIWLGLKHNSQNQVVLTIEDDGVGFKPGLNLYNSDSLGLELVCTLVEQLDGKITLDQTKGTKIEIAFDELNYGSRI